VRSHRLWETFLIENADIAPDHVDRDADQIEHILSPDLLDTLEDQLRQAGRWPAGLKLPVPASPHSITAAEEFKQGGAS
jgi:manganese/zinc/iron transport system permease protein